MNRRVLVFAALGEAGLGVALLIAPSIVVRLLLGQGLTAVAVPIARVTGIALIGLGVACWPGPAVVGMLAYSAILSVYMVYLGLTGFAGMLLWPALALHVVLTVLLMRAARSKMMDR